MALISSRPTPRTFVFIFLHPPCRVQSHSRSTCVSGPDGRTIKHHKKISNFLPLIPPPNSLKDNKDENLLWETLACVLYLTRSSLDEKRERREVATIDAIRRDPAECPKNRGSTNPSTTKTDEDPHCWRWLDCYTGRERKRNVTSSFVSLTR
jgi:hypothetical protein